MWLSIFKNTVKISAWLIRFGIYSELATYIFSMGGLLDAKILKHRVPGYYVIHFISLTFLTQPDYDSDLMTYLSVRNSMIESGKKEDALLLPVRTETGLLSVVDDSYIYYSFGSWKVRKVKVLLVEATNGRH